MKNQTNMNLTDEEKKKKDLLIKKQKEKQALNEFKRKYFDYYDDIKISHREDW